MSLPQAPTPAPFVTPDRLTAPGGVTPARLSLGRAGSGLPTRAMLDFAADHAAARDAVHASLDRDALRLALAPLELDCIEVDSAAPDRATYLSRPDFGRRLSRNARTVLAARPHAPCDVAIVIGDGLSARAVAENAAPLLDILVPLLRARLLALGPLVLAGQARVALGDEVGALLRARLVVVLIGERPGLSAADSLGAYLTYEPKVGRSDAERNCVSNIRLAGLPPARAAHTLVWLIEQALGRGLTGVALKDESEAALIGAAQQATALPAAQQSRSTDVTRYTLAVGTHDPVDLPAADEADAMQQAVAFIASHNAGDLSSNPQEVVTLMGPSGLVTRSGERLDEFVQRFTGADPAGALQPGDANTPDCNGD